MFWKEVSEIGLIFRIYSESKYREKIIWFVFHDFARKGGNWNAEWSEKSSGSSLSGRVGAVEPMNGQENNIVPYMLYIDDWKNDLPISGTTLWGNNEF